MRAAARTAAARRSRRRAGRHRHRPRRLLGRAAAAQGADAARAGRARPRRDRLGAFALSRGERRLGWGAVVAGVARHALGYLATRSSVEQPRSGRRLVGALRRDAALRDAARLRRDRRDLLRAERRREHRPRGDDADGRLLRHLGRRQVELVGARAARRRRRPARSSRSCTRSSPSTCAPTRSSAGTAINFLALGLTGYLFIDIYGGEGTPPDISEIPDVHLGVPRGLVLHRADPRPAQPDDLARARDGGPGLGRPLQDADRPAPARGRRAPARGGDGRHLRLRDPLRRRRPLGRAGGARRRLPLDRLRRLVQPEHDGRPGLHRARSRDLRQLAAVQAAAASRCCSASRARSRTGCPSTPSRRAVLFRRCPTSSR